MVRITDVAPRDGLQNEEALVPTPDKARLIELLVDALLDEVEVASFVHAKWVPQLADAEELLEELVAIKRPDVAFSALVPNERGMARLLHACERVGMQVIDKVSVFTAASETFSTKNTNASIAETIERFRPVVALAREHGMQVRAYISCVVACPFEGPIAPEQVARVVRLLEPLAPDEIDLGDTIGAATPQTLGPAIDAARNACAWAQDLPPESWVLHLHDTRGTAPACVEAALSMGIRSFDASVAGLGGCPFASTPGERAPGNIDTRVLIETLTRLGYETRVSVERLERAAAFARSILETGASGAIA